VLTDIEPCAVMADGHLASAYDTDDCPFRVATISAPSPRWARWSSRGVEPRRHAGRGGGTGLTFGLWWMYFTVPAGQMLHVHRERAFPLTAARPVSASISSAHACSSVMPTMASSGIEYTQRDGQRIDITLQRNTQRGADVRSGPAPWTCWQEHVDATAARS
jgi:hypothetical protein